MADISNFIDTINRAVRGEEVRDAIIDAIENIANKNSSAGSLNGIDADQFVTKEDLERWNITPLDNQPIEGSTHGVTSGGLYTYLAATLGAGLGKLIQDSSTTFTSLAEMVQYLNRIKSALRVSINALVDKDTQASEKIDPGSTPFANYSTILDKVKYGATTSLSKLTISTPYNEDGTPYKNEAEAGHGYNEVELGIDFGNYTISRDITGGSLDIDEETHLPTKTEFKIKEDPAYIDADPDQKPIGYKEFSVDISDKLGEKIIEVDPADFGEETVYNAYEDDGAPFGWYKATVRIKEATGPFTVTFYSSTDKSVKLYTATVEKPHQNAIYAGPDPNTKAPTGKVFNGWNPQPLDIVRDTDCFAEWIEKSKESQPGEIADSWDNIAQTHGENVPIGAWKPMTIHGPLECSGVTLPEGTYHIVMQKVAEHEEETSSTWVSRSPLFVGGVQMYDNGYNTAVDKAEGYQHSKIQNFLENSLFSALSDASESSAFSANVRAVTKFFRGIDTDAMDTYDIKKGMTKQQFDSQHIWLLSGTELGVVDSSLDKSPKRFKNYWDEQALKYVDSSGNFPELIDMDAEAKTEYNVQNFNPWLRTTTGWTSYWAHHDGEEKKWYIYKDGNKTGAGYTDEEEKSLVPRLQEGKIYEDIYMAGPRTSGNQSSGVAYAFCKSGFEGAQYKGALTIPASKDGRSGGIKIKAPIMFGFCL